MLGPVPADGTPLKGFSKKPLALVVVYYAFATVGISFALFCLMFNIVFRKRKYVHIAIGVADKIQTHNYMLVLALLMLLIPNTTTNHYKLASNGRKEREKVADLTCPTLLV